MGRIFIVSAPSGAGKSSVCKEVIKRNTKIRTTVSHTSRDPRGKEQNGVHYHFVTKDIFEEMIRKDGFAEWATIHGNYYGTSHKEFTSNDKNGGDVILEIDGQGAMQILKKYPDAHSVFILPPSLEEMRRRLIRREEDSLEEIDRRMKNAPAEIRFVEHFEYVIINDVFSQSVMRLEHIIMAARLERNVVWPGIAESYKG